MTKTPLHSLRNTVSFLDVIVKLQSVVYLRDSDSTLFGEFLFGFFAGVRVGQVGVEILIQDLCGLFAEVAPFAPEETQTRGKYGEKPAVIFFHLFFVITFPHDHQSWPKVWSMVPHPFYTLTYTGLNGCYVNNTKTIAIVLWTLWLN